MNLKPDDIPKYSKFMTTLWNMLKLYGEPENTERYWVELDEKCQQMCRLYDDDPIVLELLRGLENGMQHKMMGHEKYEAYKKQRS